MSTVWKSCLKSRGGFSYLKPDIMILFDLGLTWRLLLCSAFTWLEKRLSVSNVRDA